MQQLDGEYCELHSWKQKYGLYKCLHEIYSRVIKWSTPCDNLLWLRPVEMLSFLRQGMVWPRPAFNILCSPWWLWHTDPQALAPVCWGDRCVPPSSVYVLQRMKPKVLRMLGKQSIKWAISAATFEGFVQQLCFSYHSLSIPPYKWNLFYSWDFSPSSLLLDEVVPPGLK